jgi:hypothetical protein
MPPIAKDELLKSLLNALEEIKALALDQTLDPEEKLELIVDCVNEAIEEKE